MSERIRFLAIGLRVVSRSVYAAELFVSPEGSDTNSGNKIAPLATLERARTLIARHKLAGNEPVTVWVQGGTYYPEHSLGVVPTT